MLQVPVIASLGTSFAKDISLFAIYACEGTHETNQTCPIVVRIQKVELVCRWWVKRTWDQLESHRAWPEAKVDISLSRRAQMMKSIASFLYESQQLCPSRPDTTIQCSQRGQSEGNLCLPTTVKAAVSVVVRYCGRRSRLIAPSDLFISCRVIVCAASFSS